MQRGDTEKPLSAPVHPGEVLLEEFMAPLDLSARRLALALKVPANRISDIVRERRGITAETAIRLSAYFGTTAQFWLNLQTAYERDVVAEREAAIRAEIEPHPYRQGA